MDRFFDSLEQKYAKKQKGSSKAGGTKNKASGGKETREKDVTYWAFVVVLDLIVCLHASVQK